MEGPQPAGSPELETQTEETIAGGDRLEALCRCGQQARRRPGCTRSARSGTVAVQMSSPSFWQGFALYEDREGNHICCSALRLPSAPPLLQLARRPAAAAGRRLPRGAGRDCADRAAALRVALAAATAAQPGGRGAG